LASYYELQKGEKKNRRYTYSASFYPLPLFFPFYLFCFLYSSLHTITQVTLSSQSCSLVYFSVLHEQVRRNSHSTKLCDSAEQSIIWGSGSQDYCLLG